jgi:hypothetical protein
MQIAEKYREGSLPMPTRREQVKELLRQIAPGLADDFEISADVEETEVELRHKRNEVVSGKINFDRGEESIRNSIIAVIEKSKMSPL